MLQLPVSAACFYLPLLQEALHLLLCCLFVSPELLFHVLIAQGLQLRGQEPVQDQDPLIQRPDPGHVSCSCHDNRRSGPEVQRRYKLQKQAAAEPVRPSDRCCSSARKYPVPSPSETQQRRLLDRLITAIPETTTTGKVDKIFQRQTGDIKLIN